MERCWITPLECSFYLSLHVKIISAKINRGEIPAARVGGSVRVDKKKLDQILEASEETFINGNIKELI